MQFKNRQAAGIALSKALSAYADDMDVLVFALPRGGVVVAEPVAKALHCPLDVLLVRKLGVPGHEELAIGAIAIDNVCFLNEELIKNMGITEEAINAVTRLERLELERRSVVYRGRKPWPDLRNKTLLLVDDGIATGATMLAAIQALKNYQVKRIIVAVPMGAEDTCRALSKEIEQLICLHQPLLFSSIGEWYEDFHQTTDDEVVQLLKDDSVRGD